MSRTRTITTNYPYNALAFMGDSITMNFVWGTMAYQFYSAVLQSYLQGLGCNVVCRNFGVSGNTSTQMLNRFAAMYQVDIPKIAVIYGGINDPGNSISSATTTSNLQSMAQTMLNKGSKVIICLRHYNNFSVNGDTTATPSGATLTLWQAEQQAYTNLIGANAGNIATCDFYGYMRNLINTGAVTQGDWTAWNVADQNTHLNANGEKVLADALLATIQAQGWDKLLV